MLKKYFVRGLLFITPIGVTALILISLYEWIIEKINNIHLQGITLTLVTILFLAGITFLGYIGSNIIVKPIAHIFEKIISKIPLVNFIYTSIKDLSNAFIGDKKKFDQPVIIKMDESGTLKKPGFITRKNLDSLNQHDSVAVYLPHSYNFSGNIYITKSENIEVIENISPSEFMKFIVSGGVTGDLD